MNKIAVLNKLASIRLAINYVLRNRYMSKQAGSFSFNGEQAIDDGAGRPDAPWENRPIPRESAKPKPVLPAQAFQSTPTYGSITDFSNSSDNPVLNPNESIKLPRGNWLVNSSKAPIKAPALQNIFKSERELSWLAPYAPVGHVYLEPPKQGYGGVHYQWTHNIGYPVDNLNFEDVPYHEPGHYPTALYSGYAWYPYENKAESSKKPMDWRKAVERYSTEENSTMGELAPHALQGMWHIPDYRVYSRVPYMWNLPNTFRSPLGRLNKSKPISESDWVSYTIPRNPITGKVVEPTRESPVKRQSVSPRVDLDLYWDIGYLNPDNFFERLNTGKLPSYSKLQKAIRDNSPLIREYSELHGRHYDEAWRHGDSEAIPRGTYRTTMSELISEFMKENPDLVEATLEPIDLYDEDTVAGITSMIEQHPELADKFIRLPEESSIRYLVNMEAARRNRERNGTATEPEPSNLQRYEDWVNEPFFEGDMATFKILKAVGNMARRGINFREGYGPTPHAPAQGLSQQNDPNPAVREEYNQLKNEVLRRLKMYDDNPRYFNVMEKWHLSPKGDSIVGANKFSLTIEQMKQILEDFKQEDVNQKLENAADNYRLTPQYTTLS